MKTFLTAATIFCCFLGSIAVIHAEDQASITANDASERRVTLSHVSGQESWREVNNGGTRLITSQATTVSGLAHEHDAVFIPGSISDSAIDPIVIDEGIDHEIPFPTMLKLPNGSFRRGDHSVGHTVHWYRDPNEDGNGNGQAAWRSGLIGRNQQVDLTLNTTIANDDTELAFWLFVDCHYWHDNLQLVIDGSVVEEWSGSNGNGDNALGWHQISLSLSSGEHSIIWRYKRSDRVYQGQDAVWVDGITIGGEAVSEKTLRSPTVVSNSRYGVSNELPTHQVTLTNDFAMASTAVTNAQYAAMLNWAYQRDYIVIDHFSESNTFVKLADADPRSGNPWDAQWLFSLRDGAQIFFDETLQEFIVRSVANHPDGNTASRRNHPVVDVNWYGSVFFCWALNEDQGLEQSVDLATWEVATDRPAFRLPTEAEWEYAARGGYDRGSYPWWTADPTTHTGVTGVPREERLLTARGSEGFGNPGTKTVGTYPANTFGMDDMTGNVQEWVLDRYAGYSSGHITNPTGPSSGFDRVIRGGHWNSDIPSTSYRIPVRNRSNPQTVAAQSIRGFRIAQPLIPYHLTFDSNGGTTVESLRLFILDPISPPPPPTRSGYTFHSWHPSLPSTMPAQDLTVVAQWLPDDGTTVALSFDTTGGSSIQPILAEPGAALTAPPPPSRTGWTFSGWQPSFPSTMPSESLVLTAQWQINTYTISFDSNGGSAIPDLELPYQTSVEAPEPPERTHYRFVRWHPLLPRFMPAEDMTVQAEWEEDRGRITFHTRGGTSIEPLDDFVGTPISPPPDPEREGFSFLYWNPGIPETMPEQPIDIDAVWVATGVEVIDDGNSQPIPFPTTVRLPAGTYRQGDESVGHLVHWHRDSNEDGNGDGKDAWRSGRIGRNQSVDLRYTTTISSENTVSFWLFIETRGFYDNLIFLVNDVEINRWSGAQGWGDNALGWHQVSFPLSAGEHTLIWRYERDQWAYQGRDSVWVDGIRIGGQAVDSEDLVANSVLSTSRYGIANELPPRMVTFSRDLAMASTSVTNAQFAAMLNWAYGGNFVRLSEDSTAVELADADPRDGTPWESLQLMRFKDATQIYFDTDSEHFLLIDQLGHPDSDIASRRGHPVIDVSWYGAQFFCWALNESLGLDQAINLNTWEVDHSTTSFRLPTEAEWEYAARGGYNWGKYPFWTSDTSTHQERTTAHPGPLTTRASSGPGTPGTNAINTFSANGLGMDDMAGNIQEWVYDRYSSNAYNQNNVTDPTGPSSGLSRVLRGGHYLSSSMHGHSGHRTALRQQGQPGSTAFLSIYGFRIARSLDSKSTSVNDDDDDDDSKNIPAGTQ